jgi:hypothetical protein
MALSGDFGLKILATIFMKNIYLFTIIFTISQSIISCSKADSHAKIASEFCSLVEACEGSVITIDSPESAKAYLDSVEKSYAPARKLLDRARSLPHPSAHEISYFYEKYNKVQERLKNRFESFIAERSENPLPTKDQNAIKIIIDYDTKDSIRKMHRVFMQIVEVYPRLNDHINDDDKLIAEDGSDDNELNLPPDTYDENELWGYHQWQQREGKIIILNRLPNECEFYINKKNKWKKINNIDATNKIEIINTMLAYFGKYDSNITNWTSMEFTLLNQNNLVPRIGFYDASVKYEDRLGTASKYPICILVDEAEIILLSFKNISDHHAEKIGREFTKVANEILNADVIPFIGYGNLPTFVRGNSRETRLEARYALQNKVVEWNVIVNDISRYGEIYRVATSSPNPLNEYTPYVYLIPKNIEERKLIESFSRGQKIKIRGHIFHGSESSDMMLQPAILIDEPGIAKSEALHIGILQAEEPVEVISYEILKNNLSNEQLTDLQIGNIVTENMGKIVELNLNDYGGNLIELNNSFDCLINHRNVFKGREIWTKIIITCKNDSEYKLLQKYKQHLIDNLSKEAFQTLKLRGKLHNINEDHIYINPCVLIINEKIISDNYSNDLHDSKASADESELLKNNPNPEKIKNNSADGVIASQFLFGEWRLETRSYNENITFNANGKYVSVIEYTGGPPASTSAEFSGTWKIDGDELIQTRNGNDLIAKIRMITPTSFEEPSEDLNWPRIWTKVVPKEIKNDTSTVEQGRIVESFVTTITNKDIRNSNGVQILDPVLILMQDRANIHRFGNPDGDDVDQFFKLAGNRAKIRSFLERGSFPQDIQQSILSGNGVKLRIRVYSNDEGKICVDVSYEGAQGDATSDFSPDQKIMTFIDSESNFRMEPSVNSAVKFQPRKGTTGHVLERRDKWVKIELENGDIGWAHESNLEQAVKSQDFVEPRIEQTKRIFTDGENKSRNLSDVKSYWNHNGSVMGLIPEGNQRTFVYVKPRHGLQDIVSPGIVLFSGKTDGKSYEGVARRFSKGLPSINYSVTGPISNNGSQVVLRGQFILRDKDVAQSETINDVLVFDLLPSE